MQHLSTSQLRQLEAIGKSPHGPQLRVLFDTEIEATNANLRKMTGDALLREQGRAILLDEIVGKLFPVASRSVPHVTESRPTPMGLTNGSPF